MTRTISSSLRFAATKNTRLPTQHKFYSKKTDKKAEEPQSILTDDLLAKAGFEDPNEPKEKSEQQESENGEPKRRREIKWTRTKVKKKEKSTDF